MSTVHDTPSKRRGLAAASDLVLAALVGTAINIVHGAFGPQVKGQAPRAASAAAAPQARKDLARRSWWDIVRRTVSEVSGDRVLAVAGGVTFYGLLSLFPALTVLVSLYGLLSDPQSISGHLASLRGVLPEGAMSIIREQIMRINDSGGAELSLTAGVGALVALWSANAATKAMMDALNIAYDREENRSFIRLNLVSLLFTVSGIAGLILLLLVVAAVPVILDVMWLGGTADVLIWIGRWPVIFSLILVGLAVLYRFAPCRPDVRWRWVTPGSLLAALGLLLLSMLFSWYAANIGKFNETYGSLGAVIGFLTWMWLSATIILVGAEFNAEIESAARGPRAKQARPARI